MIRIHRAVCRVPTMRREWKLVKAFNPMEIYVYAMGQEPWLEFISSIRYTDESNPIVAS